MPDGLAARATAVAFPLGPTADPANAQAAAALDALVAGDQAAYATQLAALAESLGARLDKEPSRFTSAWLAADQPSMTAMLSALTQLGVGYRFASSKPGAAFDCSGLVKWAWAQAGVELPANSSAIINALDNTPTDALEPGDVMWYPGHIMISLGVDQAYVNAVGRGKPLAVRNLAAKAAKRLRAADPVG